jgi:hypothetical protein
MNSASARVSVIDRAILVTPPPVDLDALLEFLALFLFAPHLLWPARLAYALKTNLPHAPEADFDRLRTFPNAVILAGSATVRARRGVDASGIPSPQRAFEILAEAASLKLWAMRYLVGKESHFDPLATLKARYRVTGAGPSL